MPKRNWRRNVTPWRVVFVLAGLAFFTALVFLSAPTPREYLAQSASSGAEEACAYEQARNAAENAARAYDEARQRRSGVRERQIEAEAAARRAENAKQCEERARNRADLDAQWRAAFAAENAYSMNEKLRWLGIVEIGLLIATVTAAFMAVFDAREHSKRELRAYVKAHLSEREIVVGKPIRMIFSMTNYGQTPVFKAAAVTQILVRANGWLWESEEQKLPTENRPEFVIHPGEDVEVEGFLVNNAEKPPLEQTHYNGIRDGHASIFARIIIWYDDAFGDSHETELRFALTGPEFRTMKPISARTGNRAT